MNERMRFVARLLEGEKMAPLCREFDISRKTGYKIFGRYKDCGLHGLSDRSRLPYRHANQLPFQIETLIVQLKKEWPTWGRPRYGKSCGGVTRMCIALPSARYTPFWTATVWWSGANAAVTGPKEPHFPAPTSPMTYGVPTIRVSLCWRIYLS